MTRPTPSARVVAALGWATCVALAVVAFALIGVGPGAELEGDLFGGVAGASFVLVSLTFGTLGAVIMIRVPRNAVGPLFLATGLVTGVGMAAYQWADFAVHAAGGPLTGALAAAWVQAWITPPVAGLLALSLLYFPDGRLPSRRWRAATLVTVAGIVVVIFGDGFLPGSFDPPFATVANPLGIPGARGVADAADVAGWLLMLAGIVAAGFSAFRRMRRARGVERQQLKWLLAVGVVVATVVFVAMASWLIWPEGHQQLRLAVIGVGFSLLPAAAGVAILRYRLYDIDVVINRAIVYGALTVALGAAYLGSVLLIGLAVGRSGFAVAVSTLAVAAVVRPARDRIQTLVDRRFYRSKYDAERTIERFGARLRDAVELDALGRELRAVVGETVQPAHVSLWLRDAP